jgi:hypothetical protein
MSVDEALSVVGANSFEPSWFQNMFFEDSSNSPGFNRDWHAPSAQRISEAFCANKCLGQSKRKLQVPTEGISRSSSVTFPKEGSYHIERKGNSNLSRQDGE